jgi:hypothetical protein
MLPLRRCCEASANKPPGDARRWLLAPTAMSGDPVRTRSKNAERVLELFDDRTGL